MQFCAGILSRISIQIPANGNEDNMELKAFLLFRAWMKFLLTLAGLVMCFFFPVYMHQTGTGAWVFLTYLVFLPCAAVMAIGAHRDIKKDLVEAGVIKNG
jgi:hypothetical protein